MRKRTCLLLLVIAGMVTMALAQTQRDRIMLGNQHYVRSQLLNNDLPYGIEYSVSLSATNDGCSLALDHRDSFSVRYAVLSDWSPYGELRFEVDIRDREGGRMLGPSCARDTSTVLTGWRSAAPTTVWLRLFGLDGDPLTDPVLIANNAQWHSGSYFLEGVLNNDRYWVCLNPQGNSPNWPDLWIRVFDLTLTAQGPWIVVTDTFDMEVPGRLIAQTDGSVVIPYRVGRGYGDPLRYPAIRRIESDLSLGPELRLSNEDIDTSTIFARSTTNGELLVGWRQTVGSYESYAYLQRLDPHGQALADPVPIDYQAWNWAANSAGDVVVGIYDPILADQSLIRLYDRFGNPRTERFDPTLDPIFPNRNFQGSTPIAIADDGTIYICWSGDDSQTGGQGSFMTVLHPYIPGDMNRDGLVNNFDIDPFVFALSNLPAYAATYNIPEAAAVIIGDINEDGVLNNFDIDPFVMLLAGE